MPIVGVFPRGTGVASLRMAMSCLKFVPTNCGWIEILETMNSCAGIGSVDEEAFHSPKRTFNCCPLNLQINKPLADVYQNKYQQDITEMQRLYELLSKYLFDQSKLLNRDKHHLGLIKQLATDMTRRTIKIWSGIK